MTINVTGRSNANPVGAVTSVSVVLPATINAGDVIYVIAFCSGGSNANMFPVPLDLRDYNFAFTQSGSGSTFVTIYYYYKVANGDEGGTTLTWSKSANEIIVEAGVIEDCDLRYGPVFAGDGSGGSPPFAAVDPPALAPPWGSAEYLWQVMAVGDVGNVSNPLTGGPSTGYDFTEILREDGATTLGIYSGYADKVSTAASEDPASYSKNAADEWATVTGAWLGTSAQVRPVAWHATESLTGTTNDVTITIPVGNNLRLVAGVSGNTAPTSVVLDPSGLNLSLQLIDDGVTTASHSDGGGGASMTTLWELDPADIPAPGSYTLRYSFAGATQRSATAMVLQGLDTGAVESVTITINDAAMASFTVSTVAASCTLLTYAARTVEVGVTRQPFNPHDLDGYPMVQYGIYYPNGAGNRGAVPMVRAGLAPGSHTIELDAEGGSFAVVAITVVFKEAPLRRRNPHFYGGC